MKDFIEVSGAESICIAGGKDSNVAKTAEIIGYIIGSIVRILTSGKKGSNSSLQRQLI